MAIKNKRKKRSRRVLSGPPKFSVGMHVRVKWGIPDPDFPDIPLGGWAGKITEVNHTNRFNLYLIEWNQWTLDNRHPIFAKRCDRDGLDDESSWLAEEDLEADDSNPVPLERPTNIVTRPLSKTDQDDRIRAILGLTGDDPLPEANGENLCIYYEYLATHLTFPFQGICWQETGPFESHKCKVSVKRLTNIDDYYPGEGHGLLCEVRQDADSKKATVVVQRREKNRRGVLGFLSNLFGMPTQSDERHNRQEFYLPLDKIEIKKPGDNRRLIADYSYWFHNF